MQFLISLIGPAPSEDAEAFRTRLAAERTRTLEGLKSSARTTTKKRTAPKKAKVPKTVAGYPRDFVENLATSTGRSFDETVAFLKENG